MSASIPERPRLAPGVRVFPCEDGFAVRSRTFAMAVEKDRGAFVAALAERLDGRATTDLCGELGLVPVLTTLGDLAAQGLLVTADAWRTRAARDGETPARLDGTSLELLGDDAFAAGLAGELVERGASVRRVDAPSGGSTAIAARSSPDLEALEALSEAAVRGGFPLVPVFALADELVVGPRVNACGPCLKCFELRWLGISRAIRLERAFLEHLRGGGWRRDASLAPEELSWAARRAADGLLRVLSDGVVVFTSIATGETRARVLHPHSLCPSCAVRAASEAGSHAADWTGAPLPLAELAPRLQPLVDDRLGLAALEAPPPRGTPADLPSVALVRFAVPRPERVKAEQQNWSHGCADREEDARSLAVVEALERWSGIAPPGAVLTAPYEDVRGEAIDPKELPLFSDAQYRRPGFRFTPFDPSRPLRWVRGFSLTYGAPRLVPVAAAHYGEADDLVEETSSGMAAHTSRRPALLSALCELVERDAFMIHWLNRLAPPLVDLDGAGDPRIARFLGFVRSSGWEPRVSDLTTDLGIPVYLASGVREDDAGAALLVGAGASLDGETALLRALRELYSAVVAQPDVFTPPEPLEPEEVERMQQHLDFYKEARHLRHAAFLWESDARVPPPAPGAAHEDPLGEAVRRLAEHGLELVGVDVTAPEAERHGIVVVRALVPGLQPLAFGRSYLRLGGRRLYEAPVEMGRRAAAIAEADLNPEPHCFP